MEEEAITVDIKSTEVTVKSDIELDEILNDFGFNKESEEAEDLKLDMEDMRLDDDGATARINDDHHSSPTEELTVEEITSYCLEDLEEC